MTAMDDRATRKEPLHIAQVTCNLAQGGGQKVAVDLSCELQARGHSVDFITVDRFVQTPYEAKLRTQLEDAGVRCESLGRSPGSGLRGIGAAWKLSRVLASRGCDVVHSHLRLAHATVGCARRLVLVGEVPHVVTVHSSRENWGRLYSWVVGKQHVAYCSESARRAGGHPACEQVVIPNGVRFQDLSAELSDPFALREELGVPADARLVISVGRMHPAKNYGEAVKAFAMLQSDIPVHYLICGGGDKTEFKKQVAEMGLSDTVHLLGVRRDIPRLLALADVFFSASIWEGMPVSALEALGSGIPCVLSGIPAHREIAEDIEGCAVCRGTSAKMLADGLESVLANSWDRAHLRKQRGPYLEQYRLEMCADTYVSFYRDAIGDACLHKADSMK